MKRLLLLLFFAVAANGFGQQNGIWKKSAATGLNEKTKIARADMPSEFIVFNLDLDGFKSQLAGIPVRGEYGAKTSHIILLPNAKGNLERFDVIETPIMEKGLADKFPGIKSYAAQGIDDPTAVARFSVTQFGLHSMTLSGMQSTVFIDPYTEDRKNYIVYDRQALNGIPADFECLLENDKKPEDASANRTLLDTDDKKLRTYRLALSCNGEYAAIFKGTGTTAQQKANVQAQMAITMTRVNGVYEKDLAITMIFVANNDQIIYLDAATDPWTTEFNTQTAQTIDSVIGVGNYDIGHNFNTTGGGNAGCIGCVCSSATQASFHKGRGYTGRSNPTGDAFDIDYVAHEMGHQFGGYHTQSNDSCRSGNLTEVETGSGSSIMGYAGICAANVQSNSDAYFAYVNIRDISLNVETGIGSSCAQITSFSNNPPVVNAGADYTIPKSTPFQLTATGSDPDGNALTYTWEERDPEAVLPAAQNNSAPTSTRTAGPMFRTITGTASPSRSFPSLATVLTGATSNTWEVLPSIARTFNFSVVARDNVAGGGQTASDLMVVNVNAVAGPFVINSPNTNVSWAIASNQTVTWDVAGTTANGINCAYVDIYLSSNGGSSFPVLLASRVPNDGTETVTVPNTSGTANRVMIRGNGNIFYDISNTNFTTTSAGSTFSLAFSGVEGGQNKAVCQGTDASYLLNYTVFGGFSANTTFSASGNPAGSTVTFTPNSISSNGTVTATVSNTGTVTPGFYTITITGTSGATVKTVKLYLEVLNATFSPVTLTSPANESYAQPLNPSLNWSASAAATSYDLEVAGDIDFTNIITAVNVATNSYTLSGLSENRNYFWRILPKNSGCEGTLSAISRFSTGQTTCNTFASANVPLAISASGAPTVNSTLTVPNVSNVTITDVNISVQITHTWVSDLTLTLISPTGTQVQLLVQKCTDKDNINCTFDDSGIALVCATLPAVTGSVIPAQPLSVLNGQSSQGVWTLRVADGATGDGGSVTAWSLNICSSATQPFSCGTVSTTWNGTQWSNGRPVSNTEAIINGDYISSGNLSACSLNVTGNAQVTFLSGHNLSLDGSLTVAPAATVTIQNNANLVQTQNVANTGNITLLRNTSMRRLDYTYWASPVAAQNLAAFSPLTVSNRFYTLNEQTNSFENINPATNNFASAKGYSIRAPNGFTTAASVFNGAFTGVPNNGNIAIALTSLSFGYNLVGNPYPSAINANTFLGSNPGTLYFWTHTLQGSEPGTNYASFNTVGGTASALGGNTPNGTIPPGQGFIMKPDFAGNASFTNAMRQGGNQGYFFRNNETEKHRIWLNLSNASGQLNQILIGYVTGATTGIDPAIDGKQLDGTTAISSRIDNENYVIQGRPLPFETTDIVPLGFTAAAAGSYSISIDHSDGLFAEGQAVFLKDNLTGETSSLTAGAVTFATAAGTFNDRFEVVFQDTTLGIRNPGSGQGNVIIYKNENGIWIDSGNAIIREVGIFDMRGRQLFKNQSVNSGIYHFGSLNIARQVLLVKVTDTENRVITQKIVY